MIESFDLGMSQNRDARNFWFIKFISPINKFRASLFWNIPNGKSSIVNALRWCKRVYNIFLGMQVSGTRAQSWDSQPCGQRSLQSPAITCEGQRSGHNSKISRGPGWVASGLESNGMNIFLPFTWGQRAALCISKQLYVHLSIHIGSQTQLWAALADGSTLRYRARACLRFFGAYARKRKWLCDEVRWNRAASQFEILFDPSNANLVS